MKILCIDGGGIRGVYPAHILKRVEDACGKPLNQVFDLVAGTSTGSIIAAAVSVGKPMEEVIDVYRISGKEVFARQSKIGYTRSFYNNGKLKTLLQDALGVLSLKETSIPLLITSCNLLTADPFLFRSYAASGGLNNSSSGETQAITLIDAVMSSCAAPVYFPPHKVHENLLAVDGGLWGNNPSMAALTDGLKHFKAGLDKLQILSIGTGLQEYPFTGEEKSWGMKSWIKIQAVPYSVSPIFTDIMIELSSEAASGYCQALLGSSYLRVNKSLGGMVPMDDLNFLNNYRQVAEDTYLEFAKQIEAMLSAD